MSLRAELLAEKCGVAAVIAPPNSDAAPIVTKMGQSLEHRGQEGSGVGIKIMGGVFRHHRAGESFNDTFKTPAVLKKYGLRGEIALAHTRYRTLGPHDDLLYAQPMLVGAGERVLMGAHNGQLINYQELYESLCSQGAKLETADGGYPVSDSEVLFQMIVRSPGADWPEKVARTMEIAKGACSVVLATDRDQVIAFKDPWGIRPLSFGRVNGHFAVASETSVLRKIGVIDQVEIERGEMWVFEPGKDPQRIVYDSSQQSQNCNFEDYYFSWPTSLRHGVPVHVIREAFGTQLGKEEIESGRLAEGADMVSCMPDTGRSGAIPFARTIGLPFQEIIFKERYGNRGIRSFIGSSPLLRNQIIDDKYDYSDIIRGKIVYVGDDSGVRLATWGYAVRALKQRYGAREVHLRSFAPKFIRPCYLGVNINQREELGALQQRDGFWVVKPNEQIAQELNADSVAFLSLNGFKEVMRSFGVNPDHFCGYCHGEEGPPLDWEKYDPDSKLEGKNHTI